MTATNPESTAARTLRPYDPAAPLGGLRALRASAGTGKTYAITSNVLRAVVEDDPIAGGLTMDRLLLVTFTRPATAELEDRVRARLVDGEQALRRAANDPDWQPTTDVVIGHVVAHARRHGLARAHRRVEEALRTVDEATVTTIHGFCHQVLQQAAVSADSDPAVAIDTDNDRLVAAVVDDWLVAFTHDAADELVELLDRISCKRDQLQQLGRTVANEPDPILAPDRPAGESFDPLAEVEESYEVLRRAVDDPDDTVEAARLAKELDGMHGGATWAATDHRMLGRLETLRAELDGNGRPTPATLDGFDPAYVTGSGKTMPPRIAATSIPRAVDGIRDAHVRVETWVRRTLADHVRSELARRRREAGTASFADLLRHLARALDSEDGEQLVATVGADYDAVFVDEFQDTDPVQWSILHRLFANVEVFHVVGDPKQAIYGWRGADLQTYLRALDDADTVTTMTTNWRSDTAYVDAINHLLGRDVHREDGSLGGRGVGYVPVETPDRVEPRFSDDDGNDAAGLHVRYLPDLDEQTKPAAVAAIAADVAQDIVDTLGAGHVKTERHADATTTRRRLVAADCAVLVRRHKEAAAVADELRRRGVPVVVGGGDDVLTSDEADAMADLLRVLVAPGDDRALRRLLVGPFVGLDAVELDGLAEDDWQDHAVRARQWALTWADDGIAAAVQRSIREGRAEARHARVTRGDRTMTNLRHLTELLHLAEQSEALGTHALAAWFDARRAEAVEEQTPPERELRLERDDAAVRVMTIHAAKGLEFPCVWVPFLWTREGLGQDRGDPFVVNDPRQDDRPRTVSLHAASRRVRGRSEERQLLRDEYELAEWEGGLRLAYVALTRAEHRCTVHLCGHDHQGSLAASPGWQLFLAPALGDGRPGSDAPTSDEDGRRAVLRELAAHPTIHLDDSADGRPYRTLEQARDADVGQPVELDRLRWGRTEPLDVRWGRSSFTGLLRGRVAPAPEESAAEDEADLDQTADRHGHALPELPRATCDAEPDVPLAPLPRGAAWGTFLHDVLEHADFAASPGELDRLVRTRADRAAVRLSDEDVEVTTRGLHAAMRTPLGPALDERRLCDLDRGDRLDELGFTLTLGQHARASFDVAAVADVFDDHADESDAPLAAAADHLRRGGSGRPVHGLLTGAIDLVLRHDGRFWIADYKSNGLGQWLPPVEDDGEGRWAETEAHTGPERVTAAMLTGDYLLQAHLYVVALHRYLRDRLGEPYDYERHVGGWAYLFLRGMTGADVRRTDGRPHGIATGHPTRALVEALDATLRGADREVAT